MMFLCSDTRTTQESVRSYIIDQEFNGKKCEQCYKETCVDTRFSQSVDCCSPAYQQYKCISCGYRGGYDVW